MRSLSQQQTLGKLLVNGLLILICLAWTIPTAGLLISSFRSENAIKTSGWWTIFPHREWVETTELPIPTDVARDQPITIEGATATFDEFREGVETPDGKRLIWVGNLRSGRIEMQERKWALGLDFSLENYQQILAGKQITIRTAEGVEKTVQGQNINAAFLNTVTVAVPSTIIPILIAAFAAYGFAWMNFPGRKIMFVMVVALLVVPLQIALIPILRDYKAIGLNGTFLSVWLAHTGFGLPLATYLLYNYISSLPRDILESAFIDGASHFTIFLRLILPLSVPALASFAIFQFLWVWNDFLVAVIFLGLTNQEVQVLTQRIQALVGQRGEDWHLLTAAAFISMVVPLTVFFSLQRYFVRGLLAGSVKG